MHTTHIDMCNSIDVIYTHCFFCYIFSYKTSYKFPSEFTPKPSRPSRPSTPQKGGEKKCEYIYIYIYI